MIVDTHVHVSPSQIEPPSAGATGPMARALAGKVSAEDLLELMNQGGVGRTVLVAVGGDDGNKYTADAQDAHPDRFSSVCVVNVSLPDAPDRLSYWIEERKMGGVRLYNAINPEDTAFDDPRTAGVVARASSLKVPVTVVTRHPEIGQVRNVVEQFPDVSFLMDHLAFYPVHERPPFALSEEFLTLAAFQNVCVKFSAVNQWAVGKSSVPASDYFETIVDHFDASRLMWGTNYPITRFRPYPELVQLGWEPFDFLPEGQRRAIMGENALRFWPAPSAERT